MAHDLVIRSGCIVDGTGSDPFDADIAIDGNTITAIGEVKDSGAEEIRADGRVVAPGFIDLHTHLDAQIGWEPAMTSITWHGVTTALMGNCGVTFAPCKAGDREFLAGMMETVEDIPKYAIMSVRYSAAITLSLFQLGLSDKSGKRREKFCCCLAFTCHSSVIRYVIVSGCPECAAF